MLNVLFRRYLSKNFQRISTMLFSSMTFVFMFLPIVSIVYLLVRKELQNYILLIASIIFYAWGEPRYLAIMFITILLNYVVLFTLAVVKTVNTEFFY